MKSRWPYAYAVIEKLEASGFEAYVVGGAVRDFLRGEQAKDIDIATNATPSEVKQIFTKTFDTGIEHGTVTVLLGEPIEVTTYRTESGYHDFRRPSEVQFVRDIKLDLARRDFTINAMALSKDDTLVDYYGGAADLTKGIIQAVGNPEERFEEDALRILRGIRFAAQLNFSIESSTHKAMRTKGHLLAHIAGERIKQEIDRIWLFSNPETSLRILRDSSFSTYLPGVWEDLPERGKSFHKASHGWAWFNWYQSQSFSLPFTNHEKKLMIEVAELVKVSEGKPWTYSRLLNYSNDAILVGYDILQQSTSFQDEIQLIEWLNKAPLRSVSELEVSGTDLMQWTDRRGGSWIKNMQALIAEEVLVGKLENTNEAIQKWVYEHQS